MTLRAPSSRVDAEEIQPTQSERALALVLAVFLLIGSIWVYAKAAEWIDQPHQPSAAQQQILDNRSSAWDKTSATERALDEARTAFDVAKANVDVAASQGAPTAQQTAAYETAQGALSAAQAANTKAGAEAEAADRAASEVERALGGDRTAGEAWAIALVRLGFIVAWLCGSLALLARLRRARPRYLPLGLAAVGTGAVLALIFAVDYITDYIDPLDLGPIVLSIIGVVATVVAFSVLQRWLSSRIPGRRVRKGECPFCGYPVRPGGTASVAQGAHCEGCGRETIGACSACGQDRRVGSQHCVSCGEA